MRKLLVLLIMVSFAFAGNHIALAASEEEVLSQTKKLYLELMEFKGDKKFHSVGSLDFEIHDGSSRKYYKYANWLNKVKALSNDVGMEFYSKYRFLPGNIEMLARDYRRTKGKETDSSKELNRRLRAIFGLDSTSKNIPKGKKMVITKDDIACRKMEYYEQYYKAIEAGDHASSVKHIAIPRCIDLYVWEKVEGPLGNAELKYEPSKYIKIKYKGKNYWISETMVK